MADQVKTAYAALDMGSSQIKIGVYVPSLPAPFVVLDSVKNEIICTKAGEALCDYTEIKIKAFDLLKVLAGFLKENKIDKLYLSICSHVSSYLPWDKTLEKPLNNHFPIWLDQTCAESLESVKSFLSNGKDNELLGTHLPMSTNWLLVKLFHHHKKKDITNVMFLQLGDAIFYELTRQYKTHFSSQVSSVHQLKRKYVPEILAFLGLREENFPEIHNETLFNGKKDKLSEIGLPSDTQILPGAADFYAAFNALGLKKDEGFNLANTSEIAGKYVPEIKEQSKIFVNVKLGDAYITYGSTNTGSNLVNWYLENILGKKIDLELLNKLTDEAEKLAPEEVPLFLPYIAGERAPLWNNELSGTMLGLRSSHSTAHLFRAIFEGVAFARKQGFDQMPGEMPQLIKICGGGSKNKLWNEIRATVLNKPLGVFEEQELSILGTIALFAETEVVKDQIPEIAYHKVFPNEKWKQSYEQKYKDFLYYQKLIYKL